LLAARGLRPKKRLGQHFLMDGGAAKRIALACVSENASRVIEIGAGTGALTRALLECGASVTAIEIDPNLVGILREREDLADATIVQADAMRFDFDLETRGEPWVAAGNLPYNIATGLIAGWLEIRNPPVRIVAMVQRDVADRLTAKPSTPQFGSLSLLAQYWTKPTRAFTLGPGVFYPKPGVDSAVVILERLREPAVTVRDRALFLQVVRAAFAYRRKTLANSLSLALGIDRARTQSALTRSNIDTEIRAEQLDLGSFAALADELVP
jgi:16S rRNA (adenine1518-N6/adenine1519-N6)-dimethyltransferase